MDITEDGLKAQLAEAENLSQVHFANFHRAQAVIALLKAQLKQLATPAPAEVEKK